MYIALDSSVYDKFRIFARIAARKWNYGLQDTPLHDALCPSSNGLHNVKMDNGYLHLHLL